MEALLVHNADKRLDAQGALEHPWIQNLGRCESSPALDDEIKLSLRKFAKATAFRRAVLSMMAWSLSAEDLHVPFSRSLLRDLCLITYYYFVFLTILYDTCITV